MLFLVGLGLDVSGISKHGLDIVDKCKKIYLDSYTVEFPYAIVGLEHIIGKKPTPVNREFIESMKIIDEARKTDVALLVYGSPLTATTHIALIDEAKKSRVKVRVIHGASILDAIGQTGLQSYKFGKTASLPGFKADSYLEVVKDNQKIKAHTLILVDIGLKFEEALERLTEDLESNNLNFDKILVCSRLAADSERIYYGTISQLRGLEEVKDPFCFIIPGELHFMEKEFLENFI